MLSHVKTEIIEYLEEMINNVKIIDDSFIFITITCKTCALIKTYYLNLRRFD
jgi:hypothetical protein